MTIEGASKFDTRACGWQYGVAHLYSVTPYEKFSMPIPYIKFSQAALPPSVVTVLCQQIEVKEKTAKITEDIEAADFRKIKKLFEMFYAKRSGRGQWVFPFEPAELLGEVCSKALWPLPNAGNFYPTRSKICEMVVSWLNLPGEAYFDGTREFTVFDPSAGNGALLDAALRACPKAKTYGVEIDAFNHSLASLSGSHKVLHGDFLDEQKVAAWKNEKGISRRFDVLLMNPPFDDMTWAEHIIAAMPYINSGYGRFAIIVPQNSLYRSTSKGAQVRNLLASQACHLEPFSAKESGFPVDTFVIYGRMCSEIELRQDWEDKDGYLSRHCAIAMMALSNNSAFQKIPIERKIEDLDQAILKIQREHQCLMFWDDKVKKQVEAELIEEAHDQDSVRHFSVKAPQTLPPASSKQLSLLEAGAA